MGVIVDEHFSWNDQIQNIVLKSSKGIGMIQRIKKCVPQSTLLKIYNAIVLSHFDYYILVWDNCSDYLLNKLQNYKIGLWEWLQAKHMKLDQKMF